MAPFIHGT